jgi:hypothetical protein
MKLTDFYNEISRVADTEGQQINATEVRRVMACAFTLLAKMDPNDAFDTVSKGIATAAKKAAK